MQLEELYRQFPQTQNVAVPMISGYWPGDCEDIAHEEEIPVTAVYLMNQESMIMEVREGPREYPESTCPACLEPISYCQGHGPIGDPAGYAILQAHDQDNS